MAERDCSIFQNKPRQFEVSISDGGKEWINVFQGRLTKKGDSYVVVGEWKDVPPGSYTGKGTLSLIVEGADELRTIAETGGYGGTVWKRKKRFR